MIIDDRRFVTTLGTQLKLKPHNKEIPVSYYKTYFASHVQKVKTQIRVSNHGTYLKYWVARDYDPSHAINISIVFSKNGIPTNDCIINPDTNLQFDDCSTCIDYQNKNNTVCKPRNPIYNDRKTKEKKNLNDRTQIFYIEQYIYNCQNLDDNDFQKFKDSIEKAKITGEYIDPFINDEKKKCKHIKLYPQRPTDESLIPHPEQIINETIDNYMLKINTQNLNDKTIYMKTIKKSQIKAMVNEAVENVLKECL